MIVMTLTLSQAITLYLEARVGLISPRTAVTNQQRLESFLAFTGDLPIERITLQEGRRYRAHLIQRADRFQAHPIRPPEEGGLSVHTIRGLLKAPRALFRWLMIEGHVSSNPLARLEVPRLPVEPPKAISDEDLARMMSTAQGDPDPAYAARDYALLCFLAETGCRVGGLVSLPLEDVDFTRGEAVVREKGAGGEGKGRLVFFGERTRRALVSYLSHHPAAAVDPAGRVTLNDPRAPLWVRGFAARYNAPAMSLTTLPLTPQGVHRLLKRRAEAAGISGRYNPHSFRHRFALTLLNNGADLAATSQMMGHSDIKTTADYYARWSVDELREKHRRFSTLPTLEGHHAAD
jgi:site-specific recombinase XerD